MKDIHIINLDSNDTTLSSEDYNIGYTQYSSLCYSLTPLDGTISFAGSLVELNESILVDKKIPVELLKELLFILNNEKLVYTLHSEAVDFSNQPGRANKILTLPLDQFDFDLYAIYSISFHVTKEQFDTVEKQVPSCFDCRILEENENSLRVYLNLGAYNLKRSLDLLRQSLK